jgi:hypothetical protein
MDFEGYSATSSHSQAKESWRVPPGSKSRMHDVEWKMIVDIGHRGEKTFVAEQMRDSKLLRQSLDI